MLGLSFMSACGGSSGASISAINPNFFSSSVSDSTMVGAFNPTGFSSSQVRKLVGDTCIGSLGGFNTQSREDGLTAFSATCASWHSGASVLEFERTSGSNVMIEITGSVEGNLVFARLDTKV